LIKNNQELSRAIKTSLLICIIGIALLSATYVIVFKIMDTPYAEPCPEISGILIVSEVGPYWVKLGGDDELLMLGSETTIYDTKSGWSFKIMLASIKDDEITFVKDFRGWKPVEGSNFLKVERETSRCQITISSDDPIYRPRVNETLLIPSDFKSNWIFSRYTQFSSSVTKSQENRILDNYNIQFYVEVDSTIEYEVWIGFQEFASSDIAYSEFHKGAKYDNYSGNIQHINLEIGNTRGSCHFDNECWYHLQHNEYVLTTHVQSLRGPTDHEPPPISFEDWQYLIELATTKFLSAIGE
jgi:hypothetical protein